MATSRVVIPQKLSGQTKTIRFCDTVGDDEDDHHYCVPPPHHLDKNSGTNQLAFEGPQ